MAFGYEDHSNWGLTSPYLEPIRDFIKGPALSDATPSYSA